MKALSIFAILLVLFQSAVGQEDFLPGYYISLQGDSVKGFVKFSVKIRNCEFKMREDSPAQIFTPAMIKGFGSSSEGRYFESFSLPARQTNSQNVFAELLVSGRADLYEYDDFFYLKKNGVTEKIGKVQQKEAAGGSGYVYTHKIYIGTLNRFFFDCLPEKLLKGEVAYKEKDFVELFRKYSECSGSEYHVYKTRPQSRKIGYYVFVGMNHSRLGYPDDLDIFNSDNNFFIGGGVTVPFPFIGNRFFLTGELTYHRNGYRGKKEGFTSSGSVEKDYVLDIPIIKLPIGFKVHLSEGKVVPYLRVGATPYFKTNVTWKIEYQGVTERNYQVREKTPTLVIWGGAGLQARIRSRRSLFVEFRMDKWPDFIGFYGPNGATAIPSEVFNKMLVFGVNL